MVVAGRVDVFAGVKPRVEYYLRGKEFSKVTVYDAGELDSRRIYGYLAHKHAALVHDLSRVLREMKAEGTFERFSQQCDANVEY